MWPGKWLTLDQAKQAAGVEKVCEACVAAFVAKIMRDDV